MSDPRAHTVLPWPKLEHKGLAFGEKRPVKPRTTKRPPAGPPQHSRSGSEPGKPHQGKGEGAWGQVSVVTWDDSQPARLGGLAYIIGDFTDIFASIFLRHVGEGEDLHVRAVNARTLQPIHKHKCKFKHMAGGKNKHNQRT